MRLTHEWLNRPADVNLRGPQLAFWLVGSRQHSRLSKRGNSFSSTAFTAQQKD